jgi:regulator of cell morphogenesis and NO signaling
MKMAEVIHMNYHLLQIVSRFGIQMGFGDKTIAQVCRMYDINSGFFLEIINSFHDKNYFPKKHLREFSLGLIVNYLKKSHEFYLQIKIPEIDRLMHTLITNAKENTNNHFELIEKFFLDYKNELFDHINREEEKVYPYVLAVEEAFRLKAPNPEIVARIKEYSIEDFENEHDNVEDKLFDLKNLLIKYLSSPVDTNLCNTILVELFRLESDLNDHARMEDKVLVPKVKYMEKWIHDHYIPAIK